MTVTPWPRRRGGIPTATASEPVPSQTLAELRSADEYSPSRFDDGSTTIDNRWFPMSPGRQLVYEGRSGLEGSACVIAWYSP